MDTNPIDGIPPRIKWLVEAVVVPIIIAVLVTIVQAIVLRLL